MPDACSGAVPDCSGAAENDSEMTSERSGAVSECPEMIPEHAEPGLEGHGEGDERHRVGARCARPRQSEWWDEADRRSALPGADSGHRAECGVDFRVTFMASVNASTWRCGAVSNHSCERRAFSAG